MHRLAWVTDPHFNFVALQEWETFVAQVVDTGCDALLISGDISESEDVTWQLHRLAEATGCPIYFVLGNHDFYHGNIETVRTLASNAAAQDGRLHYLTGAEPVALDNGWVLCGDDGWADARLGDYFRSPIRMNDFRLIDDLANMKSLERWRVLKRLGAGAAVRLRSQLEQARHLGNKTLVLTHVPPYVEACWYEGKQASADWSPFFTCHAVGWAVRKFIERFPHHEVLVLCGHTHSPGVARLAENLLVVTGGADYGHPRVQRLWELESMQYPETDWDWRESDSQRSDRTNTTKGVL